MSACCSRELFLSSCSDLAIPISCVSAREALGIPFLSVSLLHTETSPTASCQYPQCLWVGLPVLLWQNQIQWSSWNHYDSAVLLSILSLFSPSLVETYLQRSSAGLRAGLSEEHEKFSCVMTGKTCLSLLKWPLLHPWDSSFTVVRQHVIFCTLQSVSASTSLSTKHTFPLQSTASKSTRTPGP